MLCCAQEICFADDIFTKDAVRYVMVPRYRRILKEYGAMLHGISVSGMEACARSVILDVLGCDAQLVEHSWDCAGTGAACTTCSLFY